MTRKRRATAKIAFAWDSAIGSPIDVRSMGSIELIWIMRSAVSGSPSAKREADANPDPLHGVDARATDGSQPDGLLAGLALESIDALTALTFSNRDPAVVRRHRERLRKLAEAPLSPISLYFDRPGRWRLYDGNKQVSAWNEEDAPRLGSWLLNLLPQLDAAWQIAQGPLSLVVKYKSGGTNSGKERRGPGSKRERILAEIDRITRGGGSPFKRVTSIAAKTNSTIGYVRLVLKGSEKN